MSEVTCFFLQPQPKIRRYLRRFRGGDSKCPQTLIANCYCDDKCQKAVDDYCYCNAQTFLDDLDHPIKTVIESYYIPHEDPRWPKLCTGCGMAFKEHDTWQVFVDALYTRSDTGDTVVQREAPPGAMWDAWWMPDTYRNAADGLALCVRLPGGHTWCIDGPSSQQPGKPGAWTRTGTPPKISASPSILVPDAYHGWLRDGVLVEV